MSAVAGQDLTSPPFYTSSAGIAEEETRMFETKLKYKKGTEGGATTAKGLNKNVLNLYE